MPQHGSPDETVSASAEDPDWLPPEINTGVAHSARVYDYLLGGKDNFARRPRGRRRDDRRDPVGAAPGPR